MCDIWDHPDDDITDLKTVMSSSALKCSSSLKSGGLCLAVIVVAWTLLYSFRIKVYSQQDY